MKTKTNIIRFEAATATINYNITEAGLAELRKKFTGLKASDKDAYKSVTQALSELRDLRTGIEKHRVELKAESLEYGRRIDAEAKRVTGLLVEIENPLKTEKDAWDNELARIKLEKEKLERERMAAIIDRIERIKNAPLKHQGKNSNELSEIIGGFETNYINMDQFDYAEFTAQANGAKAITSVKLKEMRDLAQKQEIEAMRLTAERKQLEEEKAAWEAKKTKTLCKIDITQPRIYEIDETKPLIIDQQFLDQLQESTAIKASENLGKAIAQVEAARNPISSQDQALVDVTEFAASLTKKLNREIPTWAAGNPTYHELVWIIEQMLPRINAITQEEFEFYENVKKALKFIKENN